MSDMAAERERRRYHLHCLCHEGHADKVEKLFGAVDQPSAQAIFDSCEGLFGYTALHIAALNGHFDVLNFLLSKGGNPNLQSNNGSTPLHLAASRCRVECVRCLVRFNADPFVKDSSGRTAKQVASNMEIIQRCLWSAEVINTVERNVDVQELLDSCNAQLEPTCLDQALEIAAKNGHYKNAGWLILKDWSGLQLKKLESNFLIRIAGVKQLDLSMNGLKTVPLLADFQQVRKLCLQDNELTSVPSYLLELQNLCELILAKNKLTNLPECQQWSSSLIALDLSQNRIVALPANIRAARIRNLNLASNELTSVPLCICNFLTLQSLDLSDNKDIQTLPVQMGRLKELMELNITGLKKLREPPKDVIQNAKECIQYLGNKLYSLKPFYRIKLVIVGMQNRGKTTLAAKLQGRECGNESTVGVDISEWEYKPTIMKKSFTFNVWDFGGQEEYYATHQCFMSECSMYLLVFSLTSGDIASEEVQSWLTNISLRAPGSSIHIVGTHLDEVPAEQRDDLNILLHKIGNIAAPFSDKLQIIGIFAVGLRNELENVNLLKESIYKNASEYKFDDKIVMGQMVPASYHILDKCLSDLQKSARRGLRSPIMDKEEYKTFIRDLNLDDIQNEDELNRVSRFLTNIGTILHFEDRSHSLDKLYFVDPLWLCTMMSKIITVKEKNPFVNNGIMELSNIPHIFRDDQFPMQYFDQYLALLDRFEVALVLDKGSLLIPSMLSDIRPRDLDSIFAIDADEMIFTRYIVFDSLNTPPGFWSRLISRIMHAVPQVQCVMDKNMCVEKGGEITSITKGSIVLTSNSFNQDSSLSSQLDVMEVQLQYWRTGIVYRDRDVAFKVESLINSQQYSGEGVLIMASSNIFGRKIFGQLIDLATSLFQEWYRGGKINQICPCIDCKKERTCPLAFIHIDQCLQAISKNTSTVKCDNHHFVRLCDLVPDLLLLDINPKFILQFSEIECENNDSSLLGMGAFSKVYLGQYHGQPVAVKVYQDYNSSVVLEDLRREAMLLQRFHHPCLVCLVGICTHPKMMLVLEEAPLGSLEKPLLKTKQSIHRVVIHRIVAQVAAALKLLHSQGIIYRDLKAANILLWSLDPESLCHCKVSDLGVAIHETPIGARGIQGTRGFIAPEVLLVGKKNQSIVYDPNIILNSISMKDRTI
eukprot:Em0002g1238a